MTQEMCTGCACMAMAAIGEATRERDAAIARAERAEAALAHCVNEPWGGLGPWDAAAERLAIAIAEDPTIVRGPHGAVARCVGEEAERADRAHRTLCADSAPCLMRLVLPWMRAMSELLLLTEGDRDAERARAEAAEALAASRLDVSPEDARGWVVARLAFYEPTLDDKAAWERVDDALRAHAAKVVRT